MDRRRAGESAGPSPFLAVCRLSPPCSAGSCDGCRAMEPSLPPGPPYPSLIQGIGLWTRPLAFLERCRARYGKRFTVRFPFTPPFVAITEPDQVKEVYTAPPDVLHPGEGAGVLAPLVGRNSVILLDENAHMEQRKLMLPAFHGERMERLADLVAEVTEKQVGEWARERDPALHPHLQALTLEIILRAVFGLDPGPGSTRSRASCRGSWRSETARSPCCRSPRADAPLHQPHRSGRRLRGRTRRGGPSSLRADHRAPARRGRP